jgi:EAL domain-containing protein (putative c-di-GMP-specific phosphodiesterase class I)
VVAEGVENAQQAEFLRREECDLVQGYFYGKPVAAERLLAQAAE